MALSATLIKNDVMGSMQVKVFKLTFTGVTGAEIKTGFNNVVFATYSPRTSDNWGIVYPNYSDGGTTEKFGSVYVDSVTAADVGYLMVFGN